MEMELFFESVAALTSKAFASINPTEEREIILAGLPIRLRFAGKCMIPSIMPAIEQLVTCTKSEILEYQIDIWESTSTNTDFPQAPCGIESIQVRGELSGFKSERYETAFFSHARMLTVLDHHNKYGIVCFANSNDIPAFELACPLRGIFSWIIRRQNMAMVHAAGVGNGNSSVLIGGNSGAGKSSTALRALMGGLNYFGDDICAISLNENLPQIHGIYSSGKVLTSNLHHFPSLKSSVFGHFDEEYEKELFFFNKAFRPFLGISGNLSAVIIPHQDSTIPIGFQPISFAKALSVISSSSKLLFPDAGNETLLLLSKIFHQIPCYQFNLGNNPALIAKVLTDFLDKINNLNSHNG
jgi:hypothetical protein